MITPSRWFTGGKGLDAYRERMIADRRLRTIVDNPKLYDCFPRRRSRAASATSYGTENHDGDCEFSTRIGGEMSQPRKGIFARGTVSSFAITVRSRSSPRSRSAARKASLGVQSGSHLGSTRRTPRAQCTSRLTNHPTHLRQQGWVQPSRSDRAQPRVDRSVEGAHSQGGRGWPWARRGGHNVLGEPIALAPGSACTQTYLIAGMFNSAGRDRELRFLSRVQVCEVPGSPEEVTQDMTPDRFRFVPSST